MVLLLLHLSDRMTNFERPNANYLNAIFFTLLCSESVKDFDALKSLLFLFTPLTYLYLLSQGCFLSKSKSYKKFEHILSKTFQDKS